MPESVPAGMSFWKVNDAGILGQPIRDFLKTEEQHPPLFALIVRDVCAVDPIAYPANGRFGRLAINGDMIGELFDCKEPEPHILIVRLQTIILHSAYVRSDQL